MVLLQPGGVLGDVEYLHTIGGHPGLEQETPPAPQGGVAHLGIGVDALVGDLPAPAVHQLQLRLAEPFQLCLHQSPVFLSGSVHHKQGEAVFPGGYPGGEALHGNAPEDARLGGGPGQLHHGLVPGLADGSAAEGVVEGVEQYLLPQALHPGGLRHPFLPGQSGHGHQAIRLGQSALCLTVEGLEGGIHTVAALVDFLKGAGQFRLLLRGEVPEELLQSGKFQPGIFKGVR